MLVAVCACGFGGLPRPDHFFKRIDVFLQSRYACCGVRLRVRWLAPPGAHNDLRWFRWHAPSSSKDSEGALLKPPFSGSVLRKAFVCKGGSKNKTFVGSLPASLVWFFEVSALTC